MKVSIPKSVEHSLSIIRENPQNIFSVIKSWNDYSEQDKRKICMVALCIDQTGVVLKLLHKRNLLNLTDSDWLDLVKTNPTLLVGLYREHGIVQASVLETCTLQALKSKPKLVFQLGNLSDAAMETALLSDISIYEDMCNRADATTLARLNTIYKSVLSRATAFSPKVVGKEVAIPEHSSAECILAIRHFFSDSDSISVAIFKKDPIAVSDWGKALLTKIGSKIITLSEVLAFDKDYSSKIVDSDIIGHIKAHAKVGYCLWHGSRIGSSVIEFTRQTLFPHSKNECMVLYYPSEAQLPYKELYLDRTGNHPSIPGKPTVGWVRFVVLGDLVYVEEVQSDWYMAANLASDDYFFQGNDGQRLVDKIGTQLRKIPQLLLATFCRIMIGKGYKKIVMPDHYTKVKAYNFDQGSLAIFGAPPKSIYEDLPKSLRFRKVKQAIDYNGQKWDGWVFASASV